LICAAIVSPREFEGSFFPGQFSRFELARFSFEERGASSLSVATALEVYSSITDIQGQAARAGFQRHLVSGNAQHLLPWDQLAFWAITVGSNIMSAVPVMGAKVRFLMLGGHTVNANALLRFRAALRDRGKRHPQAASGTDWLESR
jgi:hypothetical protein